jgi:hypothetical protein
MFDLKDLQPKVTSPPHALPLVLPPALPPSLPPSLPPGPEGIVFENVSFAYGPHKILRECSFKVPYGQTVAVVGPSGCGKSTLLRLLYRFYDVDGGSIHVRGEGGKSRDGWEAVKDKRKKEREGGGGTKGEDIRRTLSACGERPMVEREAVGRGGAFPTVVLKNRFTRPLAPCRLDHFSCGLEGPCGTWTTW